MSEAVHLTGMVLRAVDYGEYDKRLVLLTAERGKVTVFAHGVRRANNRFMAACAPFAFGEFSLGEGRSAYNLRDAKISNYFEALRFDLKAFYYGSYFLEIAEYYTRENNDDVEMLKLLYQSVKALVSGKFDIELIRSVYEIRSISINGEFPGIPSYRKFLSGTERAIAFMVRTPIERLYTFELREDIMSEISELSAFYVKRFLPQRFKSLTVMNELGV